MEKENRLIWIDTAKGIAILMVMWGHIVVKHDALYRWITTFHVPAFLVITGYLYGIKSKKNYDIVRIAAKFAKPYLVFSIISCCTDFAYEFLVSKSILGSFRIVAIDAYKTLSLYGIHALWYLPAYVIASKLFFYIKDKRYRLIGISLVCTGILFCSVNQFAKGRIPSPIYLLVSIPATTMIRALVCTVFIILGYAISKWGGVRRFLDTNKCIKSVMSCLLLGTSFALSAANTESNLSIVSFGNRPMCFFLSACLGAIGLMAISCTIQLKSNRLQYLGRNSLILLVTHHSLKFTFIVRFVVGFILPQESVGFGVVSLILLVMLEVMVVKICTEKYKQLFL